MNIDNILQEIRRYEKTVLDVIDVMTKASNRYNFNEWLSNLSTSRQPDVFSLFGFPTRPQVVNALLSIVRDKSDIAGPITSLLGQRVALHLAPIEQIAAHTMADGQIKDIPKKLHPVKQMIDKARQPIHRKTWASVVRALNAHDLSPFRESLVETDLWIVLKTLQEYTGEMKGLNTMQSFVWQHLNEELRRPGHIPEPRHAWWAIATIVRTKGKTWLQKNRGSIEAIYTTLLDRPTYSPREDIVKRSIVPELHDEERENLWRSINICLLLRKTRDLLSEDTLMKLKSNLESTTLSVLKAPTPMLLQPCLTRLLLCYEVADLLDQQTMYELIASSSLDLEKYQFGEAWYSGNVVRTANDMLSMMKHYLKNPQQWSSPTLTSGMLCGLPGQGKSHLLLQFKSEIDKLLVATKIKYNIHVFSMNKDTPTDESLFAILDNLEKDTKQIFLIDEFDKSNFNMAKSLLSVLETVDKHSPLFRSCWLFAQSAFPTLKEYKEFAENQNAKMHDASLRDFLSRLKWGCIELTDVRKSSLQRVLSAIGLSVASFGNIKSVDRAWLSYVASRKDQDSNRDIRTMVMNVSSKSDNILKLRKKYSNEGIKSLHLLGGRQGNVQFSNPLTVAKTESKLYQPRK